MPINVTFKFFFLGGGGRGKGDQVGNKIFCNDLLYGKPGPFPLAPSMGN